MITRCRLILLFYFIGISVQLTAQSLERKFYYEVAPNLSFGKFSRNHEKIDSRQAFVPFFGLGVGYYFPLGEQLFLDASFSLHGSYYRINSHPSPTGSSGFSPMLRLNVSRFFFLKNEKFALVPQVGAALAYSFEEQESVLVRDTVSGDEFEAFQTRVDGFTGFAHVGIGVFFRMDKRNILLSLLYSQGLQDTYYLNMIYRNGGKIYNSRFVAQDSFVSLQLRIFLKNRAAVSAIPSTAE